MELMLDIRIACRKLQIIKILSRTTIVSNVPAIDRSEQVDRSFDISSASCISKIRNLN